MKSRGLIRGALAVVVACLCVWAAQAVELSPEQRQLLQQLSPAEQAKALEMFNQRGGGVSQSTPAFPETVKPRPAPQSSAMEAEARDVVDAPVAAEPPESQQKINQALKPFGYDLFAGVPSTFAPATDIPVPAEYIIGPGDTIQVQLFGKDNAEYSLPVGRDGGVNFPGLGAVSVAGLSFPELKDNLMQRVERQLIGVKANISLGPLRSIRIFVLGDVQQPGSYTVSGLSTMTNALFVSGGVRPIGSLRDIQLKRNGKVITQLDLYDLLLRGDTRADARLQPGDVIFVPPIGATVGVGGEVKRPAIYEIKQEKTLAEVLSFSGGLLSTAYPEGAQLERITRQRERTLLDVNLTEPAMLATPVSNGDVLRVYSVLDRMENIVKLSGHAQRPGGFEWRGGMRLTDLIPSVKDLLPEPDLDYVLIKRELLPAREIRVFSADLRQALAAPADAVANPVLQARDDVMVFGVDEDRAAIIAPLIKQLQLQARFNSPPAVVTVSGNVRHPGSYPFEPEMRITDLIRAAVDILPETDLHYVLVKRQRGGSSGEITVRSIDLSLARENPQSIANLRLAPQDEVMVFSSTAERDDRLTALFAELNRQAKTGEPAQLVSVDGRVKFPGQYPLEEGMRISDLMRAGGQLTEAAYTLEAELTRYGVVNGEYREIQHQSVNMAEVMAGNHEADLVLRPHDRFTVKELPQWREQEQIKIMGEVRFPGTYPIRRGETLSSAIARAGGLTEFANADGSVFMREALRLREQEQMDALHQRLQEDIAALSLEQAQANPEQRQELQVMSSLAAQLDRVKAAGRLVIDLPAILAKRKEADVVLKDGDTLVIPAATQSVTVIGEVFHPTSHLYRKGLDRNEYVNLSGGPTKKADDDRIYVVRANGAVMAGKSSGWFRRQADIRPGDTIVVPMDVERLRPLTLWTSVSQIVYQFGLAIAAWNTVGVL